MVWLSVIFLAAAVSFDALAIGITYGLNSITISFWPKMVLSLISGCTIFLAILLGRFASGYLPARFTAALGALIFIGLGFYNIWRNYRLTCTKRVLIDWRVPVLGLIIQVFQEPLSADCDQSQHITVLEAVILGGALSLDALAAGVAAAILGLPLFSTAGAAAAASFLFISQGLKTGAKLALSSGKQRDLRWVPGTIIIIIGVLKFFF